MELKDIATEARSRLASAITRRTAAEERSRRAHAGLARLEKARAEDSAIAAALNALDAKETEAALRWANAPDSGDAPPPVDAERRQGLNKQRVASQATLAAGERATGILSQELTAANEDARLAIQNMAELRLVVALGEIAPLVDEVAKARALYESAVSRVAECRGQLAIAANSLPTEGGKREYGVALEALDRLLRPVAGDIRSDGYAAADASNKMRDLLARLTDDPEARLQFATDGVAKGNGAIN